MTIGFKFTIFGIGSIIFSENDLKCFIIFVVDKKPLLLYFIIKV